MKEFNKQDVQAIADLKAGYTLGNADVAIVQQLALDALALLDELKVTDSKRRELAAENEALREYAVNYVHAVAHWNSWADEEDKIPSAPETPETDAFLAEAEARGVDKFATELGLVYKQLRPGSNHAHALKSAVFRAVEFAAQLRQGAAL